MESSVNSRIIIKTLKLLLFFSVVFILLFCITWQNIHMYLLDKEIENLTQKRNDLEKEIYLKNIVLSKLSSREKIKKIAEYELGMIPVSYKDVKLIVY